MTECFFFLVVSVNSIPTIEIYVKCLDFSFLHTSAYRTILNDYDMTLVCGLWVLWAPLGAISFHFFLGINSTFIECRISTTDF